MKLRLKVIHMKTIRTSEIIDRGSGHLFRCHAAKLRVVSLRSAPRFRPFMHFLRLRTKVNDNAIERRHPYPGRREAGRLRLRAHL